MQDNFFLTSCLLLLDNVAARAFMRSSAFLYRDTDTLLVYLLNPAIRTSLATTAKKSLRGHWTRSIISKSSRRICKTLWED